MNEIYKKLTTIKLNKFKLEKIFLKIKFSFSKVVFFCFRSHERLELLAHHLYINTITASAASLSEMTLGKGS